MTRRALLLDRDGVINVDRNYVCAPEQFEFVDGIFDLCTNAAHLDYLVIVVTNQAGIGRGYFTEEAFLRLTGWMCAAFRDRGAPISGVYHCPHHPEHGIGAHRRDSIDRKPGPGMILQAAADFELDLRRSTLLGDKETDIQAGVGAGVGCNLLYRPKPASCHAEGRTVATSVVTRLSDVLPFLKAQVAEETA